MNHSFREKREAVAAGRMMSAWARMMPARRTEEKKVVGSRGDATQLGELFVKGDGDEFVVKEHDEDEHDHAEGKRRNDIALGGQEDVPEDEALEVDRFTGGVVKKE